MGSDFLKSHFAGIWHRFFTTIDNKYFPGSCLQLILFIKYACIMLKFAIRYGGLMFIGLTVFFLLMHLLGLSDVVELRYLNLVIQLTVLWFGMRAWVQQRNGHFDNYSENVAFGLLTSGIGAGAFSIFLILFLYGNPSLMASMQSQMPPVLAEHLDPGMTGVFTFSEAVVAALIGSYVLIRVIEARYYRSV